MIHFLNTHMYTRMHTHAYTHSLIIPGWPLPVFNVTCTCIKHWKTGSGLGMRLHTCTLTLYYSTDRPAQLKVADISSTQMTLTWEKLSGALPNQLYRVFCNGTAQGDPTTESSCVIPRLSCDQLYSCIVVGILQPDKFNSLHSFEVLFIPGKKILFYVIMNKYKF